ncbi:hypothetical protein Q3C01_05165 [Bradyrhizobium sp. UFLA05-109]
MGKLGNERFRQELRALIAKYIKPTSTFEDYCSVTDELAKEERRLGSEAEKFSEEEVNAAVTASRQAAIKGG